MKFILDISRYSRRIACIVLSGVALNLLCCPIADATPVVALKTQSVQSSIGLNKFDLFKQYLGTASGGDGGLAYRRVTQGMAKKAIADAHDIGVSFLRISATGFAPASYGKSGDLDLWRRDPLAYWDLFDQMMNDLSAQNMSVVLTLVWNTSQFPAMTGETIPMMLRNPDSKSFILLSQYVTELVKRYRAHNALMFYELTNEMNLSADLDSAKRCRKNQPAALCETVGNYSTDDVIAFTVRLAGMIRKLDNTHLISSGFSVPRAYSAGLRQSPEWQTGALAEMDTQAQFQRYLGDVNQAADIISVHLYGTDDNRRFGSNNAVDSLAAVKTAADQIGKPVFVGEFGDPKAFSVSSGSFTDRLLSKLVELRIPYSAMWAWEFYQKNTYTTYDSEPDSFNLEPGYTDRIIEKLKQANIELGNSVASSNGIDTTVPRVVLTWPLECTQISEQQKIYAVASDDSGKVNRVEFWLDGSKLGTVASPPYMLNISANKFPQGEHEIVASAFDLVGNHSEWKTIALVGKTNSGGHCANAVR
jgi:hypothetical protein